MTLRVISWIVRCRRNKKNFKMTHYRPLQLG